MTNGPDGGMAAPGLGCKDFLTIRSSIWASAGADTMRRLLFRRSAFVTSIVGSRKVASTNCADSAPCNTATDTGRGVWVEAPGRSIRCFDPASAIRSSGPLRPYGRSRRRSARLRRVFMQVSTDRVSICAVPSLRRSTCDHMTGIEVKLSRAGWVAHEEWFSDSSTLRATMDFQPGRQGS